MTDRLTLAEEAALAGASVIRAHWRPGGQLGAVSKSAMADVATALDQLADLEIKKYLRSVIPEITIVSEEDSLPHSIDDDTEVWLVDPLDGSHNALIGLPLVGVSIAWAKGGSVQGAVVVDVFSETVLAATSDGLLRTRGSLSIAHPDTTAAVALQQAYLTPRASYSLAAVRDSLEANFPRVLYTWCPVIDLFLTARGHIVGWIAIGLEGPEYEAIRFLSRQIGLVDRQLDSRSRPFGESHTFVVAWPEYEGELVQAARPAVLDGL